MSETIQIPKGWKLKKLSEVTISHDGKRIPLNKSQRSQIKGDFPYYGASGQIDSINDYKFDGKFMLLAEDGENLNSRKKPIAFIVEGKFWVNNHAHVLEPNEEILIEYLCYYINSLNIMNFARKQGTRPKLNKSVMNEIPILLPSIPTQNKIVQKLVNILGQLEEKKKAVFSIIEKNKEKIDFFEKNWFTYIIDREIEKHPQQKEWKKTTVGNEIEFAYGKSLPKTKRIEGDFPVYGSNGIVGSHHEFLIDFPSIVIGRKGTVGSVHKANAKFWPTDVSFYVKINDPKKLQLDFAYFLLLHLNLPKYRQSGPKSGLNRHDAYKIEFSLPPIPTQKQIIQNIKNAEEKFKSQKTQFENIKENYENSIKYINHIQYSILDVAFSGKLVQ